MEEEASYIDLLPAEIIDRIFEFSADGDWCTVRFVQVGLVSKRWRAIALERSTHKVPCQNNSDALSRDHPLCWRGVDMQITAKAGALRCLRSVWIEPSRREKLPTETGLKLMRLAVSSGNLEMAKWLRTKHCPMNRVLCWDAAEKGDLKMLEWLRENRCPWNHRVATLAARHGHLDLFKWALRKGCIVREERCMREALERGNIDVIEWLRWMYGEGLLAHSATRDAVNLRTAEYLFNMGVRGATKAFYKKAVQGGRVRDLEKALELGLPIDPIVYRTGALYNRRGVLQWAMDMEVELTQVDRDAIVRGIARRGDRDGEDHFCGSGDRGVLRLLSTSVDDRRPCDSDCHVDFIAFWLG